MTQPRALVGCECSGQIRRALRARGIDAWSCDIKPAADADPHHFHCDVREVLDRNWDLGIFHPDCTYLTSSGLHWNNRVPGRALKTEAALKFVQLLLSAPIPRIALENPQGCIGTRIRPADQYIQPYDFGDDASKKTGWWLKNLPLLTPTRRAPGRIVTWRGKRVERWANQTDSGQNRLGPSEDRAAKRSETYSGIASAVAAQWGSLLFQTAQEAA